MMNSQNFSALKNISWYCCHCGLPNFSSELFQESISVSNSYSSLDSSYDFSVNSDKFTTSTPTKPKVKVISGLNTLVVNFQSFFHKRIEFSYFCKDLNIDVVLATESWLSSSHSNSELKLNDYDIFRNDRSSRGGGVFVAVKKDLCGELIESSTDVESIFVKINIKKAGNQLS